MSLFDARFLNIIFILIKEEKRKMFIKQKYVDKIFVKRTNSDEYSSKNECKIKAFKACTQNDILTLMECYAQGFKMNTLDDTGATLLHIAAKNGSNHVLEFCLQNGCDASHKDNDSKTALMYSEVNNHDACKDILLPYASDS